MIIIGGKRPWPWFHTTLFPDMRTSIIKIRGLSDRLIFIMGIILLVIFSTETVPSLWRLRRRRWVNISMILYRQFYPHLLIKNNQLVRYTINQPALRIQPLMKLLCIYIYVYFTCTNDNQTNDQIQKPNYRYETYFVLVASVIFLHSPRALCANSWYSPCAQNTMWHIFPSEDILRRVICCFDWSLSLRSGKCTNQCIAHHGTYNMFQITIWWSNRPK